MVRVKNIEKAQELKKELEELQDKTLSIFSMDDEDLGKEQDVYNKIYQAVQAIDDILSTRIKK